MNAKRLHFPVSILRYNENLIIAAAKGYADVTARLDVDYAKDTETMLAALGGDVVDQSKEHGELGVLTKEQELSLVELQHLMSVARKTAKLAFPGQTVKLRQEFQIGAHQSFALPALLQRADVIFGSLVNLDNLAALKTKGWTVNDSKAFETARAAFGTPEEEQEKLKAKAKASTGTKNEDAVKVYERLLTIQNAANLQYPATSVANAEVRAEFRLGIFPPEHHHSPEDHPTPTPTPPNP